MLRENRPVSSAAAYRLAAELSRLTEEMGRIKRLLEAGHRREAIEQFHALAAFAIRTQRALPLTAARVLAFVDMFDIVLCELPGHGASGEVAEVSFAAFAQSMPRW